MSKRLVKAQTMRVFERVYGEYRTIKREKIKPAGILCASHLSGICAVNFYAEMPYQTEKEQVCLSHPIVDKNPRQMHRDPEWDCSGSGIYIS